MSLTFRNSASHAATRFFKASSVPGCRTLFTVIHQGHEGWRLSLGRNPTRLSPGLRLMIPLYHSVQVRESINDVIKRSIEVEGNTNDLLCRKWTCERLRSRFRILLGLQVTMCPSSFQARCSFAFGTLIMHALRCTTSTATSRTLELPPCDRLSAISRFVVLCLLLVEGSSPLE